MQRLESHASFGGRQEVWQHDSHSTNTAMKFAIYLPKKAIDGEACDVLYWLSGLTCTEQNFINKAGAQQYASQYNLILVAPDSSPRGDTVADADRYDLGQGASFYINATQTPWTQHYQMYDYIVQELPNLIEANFAATTKRSIFGHSMGGHGALMIALKNPKRYTSVSAFSPIVAPSQVPWGQRAFSQYLGDDSNQWSSYDTVALIKNHNPAHKKFELFIDQGSADEFLANELKPSLLAEVCQAQNYPLTLREHAGYDHSYYFISSFIGEHITHHAKALASLA